MIAEAFQMFLMEVFTVSSHQRCWLRLMEIEVPKNLQTTRLLNPAQEECSLRIEKQEQLAVVLQTVKNQPLPINLHIWYASQNAFIRLHLHCLSNTADQKALADSFSCYQTNLHIYLVYKNLKRVSLGQSRPVFCIGQWPIIGIQEAQQLEHEAIALCHSCSLAAGMYHVVEQ